MSEATGSVRAAEPAALAGRGSAVDAAHPDLTDETRDDMLRAQVSPASQASERAPSVSPKRRPALMRWLLVGELPFLAVVIVAGGAFVAGQHAAPSANKVASAEKGAIVLETMLAHPEADERFVDQQLRQPILAVVRKYADRGYTVLDASRDDAGNLAVVAMPTGVLDITDELRKAVREASASAVSPAGAASSSGPAHE